MADLRRVREAIIHCERCPRLRHYCAQVAREKRAAYRNDFYWGRPVPGFGDPKARMAVVGLAPAAHGANRTGRPFTGDGAGGSGDFLMAAMHAHGLASQPISRSADDGLVLIDAWMAAAVRCAPPGNKPTLSEIAACLPHLRAELDALPNLQVIVALGRIAFDACWRLVAEDHSARLTAAGRWPRRRPPFEHGRVYRLPGAPAIVAAYHPSRQNTHTGRLTAAMLGRAFGRGTGLFSTETGTSGTEVG
jgi:uracil-DNA glycosylase